MDERIGRPVHQDQETHGLSPFLGTAKDLLEKYTHCAICDAYLHFSYVTDFSRNLTQETARCPECGIRSRQVVHKLQ